MQREECIYWLEREVSFRIVDNGIEKLMKYLRENNFERYVYTLRELKMNDIGPHLPIPSYRQTQSASELKLRFRNDNRYPPNPFYQDGKPE